MIKFDRIDSKCQAIVELNIVGAKNWDYKFEFNENDIPTAQLVINAIKDQMNERLKVIREKAYEDGWKDAKAKKRRQDWFAGGW